MVSRYLVPPAAFLITVVLAAQPASAQQAREHRAADRQGAAEPRTHPHEQRPRDDRQSAPQAVARPVTITPVIVNDAVAVGRPYAVRGANGSISVGGTVRVGQPFVVGQTTQIRSPQNADTRTSRPGFPPPVAFTPITGAVPHSNAARDGGPRRGPARAGNSRYAVVRPATIRPGLRPGLRPARIEPFLPLRFVRPFARPYYRFTPRFSAGFTLMVGYPVAYPYSFVETYGAPAAFRSLGTSTPTYAPESVAPVLPMRADATATEPDGSDPSAPPQASPDDGIYGGVSFGITPVSADVYVDGTFVGTSDEFSPTRAPLTLAAGGYHIDMLAPGYQTESFDVTVTAGEVLPYEGALNSLRRE